MENKLTGITYILCWSSGANTKVLNQFPNNWKEFKNRGFVNILWSFFALLCLPNSIDFEFNRHSEILSFKYCLLAALFLSILLFLGYRSMGIRSNNGFINLVYTIFSLSPAIICFLLIREYLADLILGSNPNTYVWFFSRVIVFLFLLYPLFQSAGTPITAYERFDDQIKPKY